MIKEVVLHDNKVTAIFETKDEALLYAPGISHVLFGGQVSTELHVTATVPTKEKATSYVEAMIGRILVKPDEFKYGGKIVIPDKHQRRPTVGTIEQVNLADGSNPNHFKVGDRIVYGVYSGTPVLLTIDQVETPLIVLTPEEVLVRLHGKTDLKEAGQGY